jgi:purine-nucleoside phosphorylase
MSDSIQRLRDHQTETAIVLGSGLNSLVADARDKQIIPYTDFAEIPQPTVPGHAGQFVLGEVSKTRVIFAQGRVHLYEGFSAREVTSIVRILAEAGIKRLILTNAAGGLNPKFKPGDWMMIVDHINLTGTSPLAGLTSLPRRSVTKAGPVEDSPQRARTFVDLTDAYSPGLREKFREAARKIGMVLHQGIYAADLGPQYETPAEVKMLRSLGADAIGMSTVLETIQARALGLEVAGFSCITNLAAGISKEKLSHAEVLEVGKKTGAEFARLLEITLPI